MLLPMDALVFVVFAFPWKIACLLSVEKRDFVACSSMAYLQRESLKISVRASHCPLPLLCASLLVYSSLSFLGSANTSRRIEVEPLRKVPSFSVWHLSARGDIPRDSILFSVRCSPLSSKRGWPKGRKLNWFNRASKSEWGRTTARVFINI